jgi:crotonobetainyl-CoA:carnitine CoA-transferase CaiB-like acyl-CoA transferase
MHLSRASAEVRLRPPEAGEHNQEILTSLGYGPEEIAGLSERGVI